MTAACALNYATDSPPLDGAKLTLLVVDDESGPRESIRIVFDENYHVLTASNGREALQVARRTPIDVAILDIRMAGLSGIEVLGHLKEIDRSTEVIMLTAYETLETARQALRLGACEYLDKPFDVPTLRRAVSKAMEKRLISKEIQAHSRRMTQLQAEINDQRIREEITRTRGEIYASIIHDINGPLTIIAGFIEVIAERVQNTPTVEGENLSMLRDRLERVGRQVKGCLQISRRYLSFLRGPTQEGSSTRMFQIFADLKELLKSHSSAYHQHLKITPPQEDMIARINGIDLIQILLNLTINALQSTPNTHSVTVQCRLVEDEIPISRWKDSSTDRFLNREAIRDAGAVAAIIVEDDGPGIPPDVLSRVFEPYFTTKPAGEGTGLGLAIVNRLIQENRGALHLHTEPQAGTRFTIYLPIQPLSVTPLFDQSHP